MTTPGKDGLFEDWVMVGCTVYTGIIVTVNLKVDGGGAREGGAREGMVTLQVGRDMDVWQRGLELGGDGAGVGKALDGCRMCGAAV